MKTIYWLLIIWLLSVALFWQATQMPPPTCTPSNDSSPAIIAPA